MKSIKIETEIYNLLKKEQLEYTLKNDTFISLSDVLKKIIMSNENSKKESSGDN